MKRFKIVIIVLVLVGIVVYYYNSLLNNSKNREEVQAKNQVDEILEMDLEKDYPAKPEEVVELFAKINKYMYNQSLSDEKTKELNEILREVFDEELLKNNREDTQLSAFTAAKYKFEDSKRIIMDYKVNDTIGEDYATNDYGELCTVDATFYLKDNSAYPKEMYTFMLRKDDSGKWKILGWKYAE